MRNFFRLFYRDLFINDRLFVLLGTNAALFVCVFFLDKFALIPYLMLLLIAAAVLLDMLLLYRMNNGIEARRITGKRLSNGDDNPVELVINNHYGFRVELNVIDEVPFQFQLRDKYFNLAIPPRESSTIHYDIRPVKRGEYGFGLIRVYVSSPVGLIKRRYNAGTPVTLPVFPSFLKLRQYELMAVSNNLTEFGIKKIRKVGHSMEFDQVKNYVGGDDIRTINWKATARKGDLMVNAFVDERAQHIYSVIDKSRVMRMPFEGMTLLDYAINATVALSKVALIKDDKAGLITVGEQLGSVVKAEKRSAQLNLIMQALYKEKSRYLETNLEALYAAIRTHLNQRSLVVFYTNFESMSALRRQLPFLKRIAKYHLLLVVFFENTELTTVSTQRAENVEDVYRKAIAGKFIFEKKMIVKELMQHGILSILTPPQKLTVNVVNRYLALKAQQRI